MERPVVLSSLILYWHLAAGPSAPSAAVEPHAIARPTKIVIVPHSDLALYGRWVRVERHWWNSDSTMRGHRDVYIRTDGESCEVEAQAGGNGGRSKTHQCPSRQSAEILAAA
ncbi:hypothetical protein [Dactylosporangium sp. NPDC048998]|uniref:hypothetical protein n=1 Tax=Dactylosporangium sp. NPDC048998 TaxID=3363976 RepID=UPI003718229E